ncbi:hypothetical protein Y032_0001g117 [Ancylostoma ceylanicum]|uniref:Uncharacterized protein n=1 Tax=Ancylostoma ceylanicum TaxID=53326 RepID=A0A016W2K7_9BILA|nr:hypothetical protein Y032_0001g117 [Ancylostoma ceylanicum]
MLDDQFRMRVDTGCTADSRDSGIDVRSRSRIIPKRAHRLGPLKPVMEDAEEPKWDDVKTGQPNFFRLVMCSWILGQVIMKHLMYIVEITMSKRSRICEHLGHGNESGDCL